MSKRLFLCLAHMSGNEERYIKEAFDTNWVVPLGPNVNGFERDLKRFMASPDPSLALASRAATIGSGGRGEGRRNFDEELYPQSIMAHENDPEKLWTVGDERLRDKQVVALASGTAAVHLSLVGLGVQAGDEVICQSFTFCASSHPVTYLGARPVFVDSERDTWNMAPQLLEDAIRDRIDKTGRKPKAIIVVYLYGMPAKIDEIKAVAEK